MVIFITVLFAILLYIFQKITYERYWDNNLSVELNFSDKHAFEGESLTLSETITNRKFLPLPWLTVKFQVSRNLYFNDTNNTVITDYLYRNDLFSIMMYQKINRRLPFVCGKRGYYTIKSIDIVSSDLFITTILADHITSDDYIYVYPKLIPIEELLVPYQKIQGQLLTKRYIAEDPFEFRGIRQYQNYDSMKAVNWKATARTGQLKVNVNDYTASQEIVIFLNLEKDNSWQENTSLFEETIRIAASLASYYIEDGVTVSIVANSKDILTGEPIDIAAGCSMDHTINIYESLARIDLNKTSGSFIDMLQQKMQYHEKEPLWVIVSSYHEKDLLEFYASLKYQGYTTELIVPKLYSDKFFELKPINDEEVFVWEVKPNEEN